MNRASLTAQSGVTLIFSLVILVSLTILGISSMQSTRTEISMAGNLREAGLTFNAAEAGLRAGEVFIDNSISATAFADVTTGLYSRIDADPDYSDSVSWDASKDSAAYGIDLSYVMSQPRFIVKYLGDRSQNEVAKVNIGGYGSSQPGITVSNFRVTARGTGQSGNSHRIVQSYYGKEY